MIYETKNGFYKKASWPYIVIIILMSTSILFGSLFFVSTKQLDTTRRSNDQLTERLAYSTNTCTELEGQLGEVSTELDSCRRTIEQCRVYCTDIDEISGRSIGTAKDAIEIIEETREAIGAMEVTLGMWDSDRYYDWLDSYVFDNEVNDD